MQSQVRFRDALGVLSDISLLAPTDSLYATRLPDAIITDTSLTATERLAKLNLTYRDRFQNLSDSGVGVVRLLTVAGNLWGASTATPAMNRTSLEIGRAHV